MNVRPRMSRIDGLLDHSLIAKKLGQYFNSDDKMKQCITRLYLHLRQKAKKRYRCTGHSDTRVGILYERRITHAFFFLYTQRSSSDFSDNIFIYIKRFSVCLSVLSVGRFFSFLLVRKSVKH